MARARTITCGVAISRCLEAAGIRHVFGIPGNHTLELYRGLDQSPIRHITTRHEQGAAFMADGYARASGGIGVCYLISGPGLLNAATALGQALADSIPILVITAVARRADLGQRLGQLHELPNQQAAALSFCRASFRIEQAAELPLVLTTAWTLLTQQRPGPVHIEVPLDVLEDPIDADAVNQWRPPVPPTFRFDAPALNALTTIAQRLALAERPALLLGGGAIKVGAANILALAEALDTPVATTVNGKGLLPVTHPLALGSSPSAPSVAQLLAEADVLLALGTEFGETDYNLLMAGPLNLGGQLLRVDIDADQLHRNVRPAVGLAAPAEVVVPALLERLRREPRSAAPTGTARVAACREARRQEPHEHRDFARFFSVLNEALPDAIVVGDSTRPTYYATWQFERPRPRRYFHSVSGFGTLGYAIPAAFGAALAPRPESEQISEQISEPLSKPLSESGAMLPVVALIGDGGAQFTLPELGTAADAGIPVTVIIWCNRGYEEIENSLQARGVSNRSTDITAPDYRLIAEAYGLQAFAPENWAQLATALVDASALAQAEQRPNLMLIDQALFVSQPSGQWYS